MPKSYSTDLRWRVVWLHVFLKKSIDEVATLLFISSRTVRRYIDKFMSTGDVIPQDHRNGPVRLLSDFEELTLVNLVLTNPGIYLHELQHKLIMTTGTEVDCSTICRTFKRLGITRQKIRHVAMQRNEESRGEFMAEMMTYDPEMFLWIDETGCDRRKLIRDYGYGIRGIPPIDHTLMLSGKRYSIIAIMSTDRVEDIYIHKDSVNGDVFLDFVRKCLLPILMPFNGYNPNSIVIMDNASVHKSEEVLEMINSVGALLRFLPPYSPDLTPIEEMFAEVKGYLKANDAVVQATTTPETILTMAFCSVSKENCRAYVRHAGYQ